MFESTVYPGVTEDICVPILERESGLKCGVDFKIGYSPERINPGDKVHRLETITKIVSGMDAETLEEIAHVYELVVEAGVHRAESIKVAEAVLYHKTICEFMPNNPAALAYERFTDELLENEQREVQSVG